MSTSTSFAPAATLGDNQHPAGTGYQRGLPLWPILFGVILIGLIWGLWKFKLNLGTSTSPLSKSLTNEVVLATRNRGPPVVARPLPTARATVRATVPPPPPPAYIHPPRYDHAPAPYGGSVLPS